MKTKLNQEMLGIDGITVLPQPETGKPLILKDVCINSLLAPVQDDTEKTKYEKYELFVLLRDAGNEVDLRSEQVVLLKKCIGKFQPPLIMGQAFDMIEPPKK